MVYRTRIKYTAKQKADIWERWQRGESLTSIGVRRAKAAFLSGCESHPAILLQPEAIGAVMEVTKWLKPPV